MRCVIVVETVKSQEEKIEKGTPFLNSPALFLNYGVQGNLKIEKEKSQHLKQDGRATGAGPYAANDENKILSKKEIWLPYGFLLCR
jgi:hypothetical protein